MSARFAVTIVAVCMAIGANAAAQTAQPARPASAAKPVAKASAKLTSANPNNQELIDLAQGGASERNLLGAVAAAKAENRAYDKSAKEILLLTKAGVSDAVIEAIRAGGMPATTTIPPPAPPQSVVMPLRPAGGRSSGDQPLVVSEDRSLPTTAEPGFGTNLRFTIFISAPQRDGFFDTSKDVQDSIKDIREKLSKEKDVVLTVIDDRSKADVILTVVQRGIGNQAYGQRVEFQAYYSGSTLEQTPMVASTYWVSTMMQVGAYRREFTGTWSQDQGNSIISRFTFGAWTKCSNQVAVNVASWTKTNAVLMNRYKLASTGK